MTRLDIVNVPKRRFTVEEYYRLAEVGILGPEDKVELINGEIVKMSPIGPKHAGIVNRIMRFFQMLLGEKYLISVQNPVRLSTYSEPEPDIAVLYPRSDHYTSRHPQPKDVALIIEVSDSTFEYDTKIKLPLYAEAEIKEYWIIDLQKDQILVHTEPVGSTYQKQSVFQRGDTLTSPSLPTGVVVEELMG